MSTQEKLAAAAAVILCLTTLWDLVRPHDVKLDYNHAGRLLLGLTGAVTVVSLLLATFAASPATYAIVFLAVLLVSAIKALADR